MEVAKTTNRFKYIDGLRGLAILMVMWGHFSMAAHAIPSKALPVFSMGARGVQLFFVISAVTLLTSWFTRRPFEPIRNFYLRRFFRIAPMFWLMLAVFVCVDGLGPRYWEPDGISSWHLALTAAFLHVWHPRTMNSVVPGGWSIGVEVAFYCVFPIVARFVTSWPRALLSFVLAVISIKWLDPAAQEFWNGYLPVSLQYLSNQFTVLWFIHELPVFMAGVLAYCLISSVRMNALWANSLGILSLLAMILFAYFPPPIDQHAGYALVFALLVLSAANSGLKLILHNRALRALGVVSYSAYFWHFLLLSLLNKWTAHGFDPFGISINDHGFGFLLYFLPIMTLVTFVAAKFTYTYVERPMIQYGRGRFETNVSRQ
jgi:peptidoglycan/LPS O-acetylase OafA/YrhL